LEKFLFAIINRKIVGLVIFKVEQWWEGPIILIEDLAVKEDFKKQGIGKNLMDKVEAYAKKNKAKTVSFSTHKKSSAVKFYKKYGYKVEKNNLFLRKEIK
jgi:ribosomal protein S18 acetylase RimI-like enzyme